MIHERRLEIGEWQTRDGQTRTSYDDIWADDVVSLSQREDGGRGQDESAVGTGPNQRPMQAAARIAASRSQDEVWGGKT